MSHREQTDEPIRSSDVAIRASLPQSDRLSTVNAVMVTERGMLETRTGDFDPNSKATEEAIEEWRVEARTRLALVDQVKLNPSYETLFLGLRKNHPHNVAVVHPLLFLVRRVMYALIIVFMVDEPFFGSVLLLLSCFMMLCFTVTEAQWEDSAMNSLHIANECSFYGVCLFLLLFTGMVPSVYTRIFLGWCLIGFVICTIAYNMASVTYTSIKYLKQVYLKFKVKARIQ